MKGTRTPHPGVTRRDWGPPSSQTTPYPKWASGARLHLPTYCIPPQCAKPAAVVILCSCFGDKAILNLSANTWRPTRFKWRPPSLIANKLLIGRPFIDPSLWIKEVKMGIKPQCFSLAKRRKKRLKARYSSWVCCQSQPRGSTAEKMIKQVALKRLTDLYKAFTSSCMLAKCCCQDNLPPQPLWSMLLVPRWKTTTLRPPTRMSPAKIRSVASLKVLPIIAKCDHCLWAGKALPIESVMTFIGFPSGNPADKIHHTNGRRAISAPTH